MNHPDMRRLFEARARQQLAAGTVVAVFAIIVMAEIVRWVLS
jgi:hypothetical protein